MLNTFKNSQDLYNNRPWLTFWVLVILGTMVLAVCSLLPGCGSDSTPKSSVKGKNAPTATKSLTKPAAVTPMLIGQKETGPGKKGLMAKPPDSLGIEVLPGVTKEKMEARVAADRKKIEAPGTEVFPGITREQLEAKIAADRKKIEAPGAEVFPGITKEQLEAKIAADRIKISSQRSEIFPDMTLEQLNSKKVIGEKPDREHMMKTMPRGGEK
jgi:hypothetical protein